MNNAHRSVWNETTCTWVAAPENAKARSKGTARKVVRAIASAVVMIGFAAAASMAIVPDFAMAGPSPSPIPGIPTGSPSGANGNAGSGTGNPGIWVNDGMTGGCIVAYDAASGTGGGTGNQWYGLNSSYGSKYLAGCDATGALNAGAYNNQTNRVLFYGQGTGATSLSLGGDLFANAGNFGLGGGQTGDTAGSMRIGGLPTLDGSSGLQSLAIGGSATVATVASGDNSIAIGTAGTASANNAIALGTSANATASQGVALGANTVANRAGMNGATESFSNAAVKSTMGAVSVGDVGNERQITNVAGGTKATDAVNVRQLQAVSDASVRYDTNVDGSTNYSSITLNKGGAATTITNVADGVNPGDAINMSQLSTTNNNVTNLGNQVNNLYDTGTKYFHANSTDMDSMAAGVDSVAIGMGAVASNAGDVALGAGSSTSAAVGTSGTTIGDTAYSFAGAKPSSTVSVGSASNERTITNVAAGRLGATSTDAVNGSQLYATNTAVNQNAKNIDRNTTDITNLQGVMADAVMYDSSSHDSVTLGGAGSTDGGVTGGTTISNVHQGKLSATSTDAVNGSQLYATNQNVAQNTTDIANLSTSINNGGIGLVQQDQSSRNITVAKDTDGALVDFTSNMSGARQLTGVADGVVAPTSLYAINGSQLFGVSNSIANAIGGGMVVNNDGSVSMPAFAVGGKTYHTVNDAITNLDGRVTNVENVVNNTSTGGVTDPGIVKQDAATGKITVGADTAGTTVDMTGTHGARTVTGVADGAVNADSADAINGSQLYALSQQIGAQSAISFAQTSGDTLNQANAYTDQQVGAALQSANVYTEQQVDAARRDANAGTAAAMAMAALPQAVQNGKGMVAMGGSTYGGQSAVALGVSRMSDTGKWIFKGTLSTNTRGTYGVGLGMGRHF